MRKLFLVGFLLGFCGAGLVQSLWSLCDKKCAEEPVYTGRYSVSETEAILLSDGEGVDYRGFVRGISDLAGADSNVCLAIFEIENPKFDPLCVHLNDNGTADLGLFQLNSKYLEHFKDKYWDFPFEFNPMNAFHNAYVAVRHIGELYRLLNDWDGVVMAYNCGYTSVILGSVPQSTTIYLERVKTVISRLSED